MDSSPTKTKPNRKSLSPIKPTNNKDEKSKELGKDSQKKEIKANKSSKSSQMNTLDTHQTSNLSFESISRPKNINEYKHILNNCLVVQSDLDWTLGLRGYDKPSPMNTIESVPIAPTFYEEDFSKHKTRIRLPAEDPFLRTDNTFKLHHLVQDITARGINRSQLNFETTLREFKLKKPSKTPMHQPKWKEVPFTTKSSRVSFLPPLTQKSKENLAKIDKYLLKEYVPKFVKATYNKEQILKKTLEQSKDILKDSYGNGSNKKYNENYGQKNLCEIRHILANHTNTLALFELGMRSYDESNLPRFSKNSRKKPGQEPTKTEPNKVSINKPIIKK